MPITPEQRARAYEAAIAHAQPFSEFENATPERLREVVTDIVSEALIALDEPEPTYPEPANGLVVRGIWADGSYDLYARMDVDAPEKGRHWKSFTFNVWLTWEQVKDTIISHRNDGVPVHEILAPLPE